MHTQESMQTVPHCQALHPLVCTCSHLTSRTCWLHATSCGSILSSCTCRPLLHAVAGGYVSHAWGIEIDRVKCDKGNAFMRFAAAEMAKRKAAWGGFDLPSIRCAPIEEVPCPLLL